MEKQKRSPKVDRRMFEACKILFEGGAPNYEVTKYTGLSSKTVARIKRAESFDDYLSELAAMKMKYHEKYSKTAKEAEKQEPEPAKVEPAPVEVKEIRQSVTVQTTHFVETKIDKMIELLKILNNKLAFIVEELTGTTTTNKGA